MVCATSHDMNDINDINDMIDMIDMTLYVMLYDELNCTIYRHLLRIGRISCVRVWQDAKCQLEAFHSSMNKQ
jgi:hypothetical protein